MRPRSRLFVLLITVGLLAACSTSPSLTSSAHAQQLILVNLKHDAATKASNVGVGGKPYQTGGSYQLSPDVLAKASAIAHRYHLQRLDGWPIAEVGMYCEVMAIKSNENIAAVLKRLNADVDVVLAQPMNTFKTMASSDSFYNDPYYATQFGDIHNNLEVVHRRFRGAGIEIAVVDTGADLSHEDLKNQVSLARNFVDDDAASFIADKHGTAVAGIIGAEANNSVGVVGIAPLVKLQILKACWQTDAGQSASCNSFTLAKALSFALKSSPDIVNISLSGPDDPLVKLIIEKLIGEDIIVIAAENSDAGLNFPANMQNVVAVTSLEKNTSALHSLGHNSPAAQLAAPGKERLTTVPANHYDFYSGSSMAAAYVSGVAALLKEAEPNASATEIKKILLGQSPDSNCVVTLLKAAANSSCLEPVRHD